MKKKTTSISIFTAPNNVRGRLGLQGFQKLLTMFFLWTTLASTGFAQGISAGAGIVAQQGTAIRLSGNLTVKQDCRFDGLISLTGHFEDHFGLELSAGDILFNGDGAAQVISGESLSTLNNMEIAAHANVLVSPSKKITVSGHLLNHNENGGLVLKASDQGITASLLHHSDNVAALVEKTFTGPAGVYHQLSSPVSAQDFEPEFYSSGDYVFTWYEPVQAYVTYENTINYPTFKESNEGVLHFLPARGYYVSYYFDTGEAKKKVFSGPLHSGIIAFTLLNQTHPEDAMHGLNFMGNPYPSAIDWNAPEGWTGKEHLAGDKGAEHKTVWVWNEEIQNYGAVLPVSRSALHNDVTEIIPAFKGFWVTAARGSDGEALVMDDRVRRHDAPMKAKDVPGADEQLLRISLSANDSSLSDEVVIEFGHNGRPVGAAKMRSPNKDAPQLFVVHNNLLYSILLFDEVKNHRRITLVAETPARGSHTLSVSGSEALIRQLVIEDRLNGLHYRASDEQRLHIDVPTGQAGNNFVLHFDHVE